MLLQAYVSSTGMIENGVYMMYILCVQGLQYIHSMGLVHLDIKPDNVFICYPEAATVPHDSSDQHCTVGKENEKLNDCVLPVYKIGW